ncbi:MAG: WYL domain-containing protein, partial [Chloroflexi bacterium]|nr:WYL domain-containing protein [Chloroflexota bacterium]
TYEIPETFDGPGLLRSAWGIQFGEQTEDVALRFVPGVTRRVKESVWHPSQTVEDTPDGGCLLRMQVANPTEMVYWIRGWGPQVKVLEPAWLREQMAREAREVARIYAEG